MGYYNCFGNGSSAASFGAGMMFFSWIIGILVIVLLVLGIIALWKYVSRK